MALLFFYIDGSLGTIHILGFYIGLLTNSLYFRHCLPYSNSLWICVMTHALINTFSQMSINDTGLLDFMSKSNFVSSFVVLFISCNPKSEKANR